MHASRHGSAGLPGSVSAQTAGPFALSGQGTPPVGSCPCFCLLGLELSWEGRGPL